MSTFRFKEFSVRQEQSAMKISTDSVILGAWIKHVKTPNTVLDIGTGTGLLALMVAQQFPNSKITGLEIEKDAFEEASHNFSQAKWSNNLQAINLSLQKHAPSQKFDFIITNPPYFVNSLHNQSSKKTTARHTSELSFEEIVSFSLTHLTLNGQLALILPITEFLMFEKIANDHHLYLVKELLITPNHKKTTNRACGLFSRNKQTKTTEHLQVRDEKNNYTISHKKLTESFYLDK